MTKTLFKLFKNFIKRFNKYDKHVGMQFSASNRMYTSYEKEVVEMKYDEALKKWGLLKLKESYWGREASDWVEDSVKVALDFNEGYACCGGRDPDCYCSFAESPSANVVISGYYLAGETQRRVSARVEISSCDFDFATVLGEICEAADGSISL